MERPLPTILFHGHVNDYGPFIRPKNNVLKACAIMDVAFTKAIEQYLKLLNPNNRLTVTAKEIRIVLDVNSPSLSMATFKGVNVYLQTLRTHLKDQWVMVDSKEFRPHPLWGWCWERNVRETENIPTDGQTRYRVADYFQGFKLNIFHPRLGEVSCVI